MVGNAPGFDPQSLALVEHALEGFAVHLERDMQIEIVLLLELEGLIRRLEKGQEGPVAHLIKGVQHFRLPAGLGLFDFERIRQRQLEEILVEFSGFLRIPAAVGAVM